MYAYVCVYTHWLLNQINDAGSTVKLNGTMILRHQLLSY